MEVDLKVTEDSVLEYLDNMGKVSKLTVEVQKSDCDFLVKILDDAMVMRIETLDAGGRSVVFKNVLGKSQEKIRMNLKTALDIFLYKCDCGLFNKRLDELMRVVHESVASFSLREDWDAVDDIIDAFVAKLLREMGNINGERLYVLHIYSKMLCRLGKIRKYRNSVVSKIIDQMNASIDRTFRRGSGLFVELSLRFFDVLDEIWLSEGMTRGDYPLRENYKSILQKYCQCSELAQHVQPVMRKHLNFAFSKLFQ